MDQLLLVSPLLSTKKNMLRFKNIAGNIAARLSCIPQTIRNLPKYRRKKGHTGRVTETSLKKLDVCKN